CPRQHPRTHGTAPAARGNVTGVTLGQAARSPVRPRHAAAHAADDGQRRTELRHRARAPSDAGRHGMTTDASNGMPRCPVRVHDMDAASDMTGTLVAAKWRLE